ncbi:MFS transporter [Alkalilimnicola sp. S0819]|nr:MFS transporter [Alkalilimnicola sp. S0819]MPQ15476.1 MFS transporter [Alkalilimnicola sp. S0819]
MPYWRLASFYFCFFAILGGLVPYWSPYLQYRGFSAAEIGELVAILHATKIIAPNLWGWLADRSGRGMLVVRLAALGAMVSFAGVLLGDGYWWMALVMATYSFFWNAALPQFEANTMNHLGRADHLYSRVRLWGSVGFIVAVIGLGEAIDRWGLTVLPPGLLLIFAGLFLAGVVSPEKRYVLGGEAPAPFLRVLCRPPVLLFFLVCFLLQASHGPYYAFFSIYLQDHQYSATAIGLLWSVGVVAEIGVFLLIHRWLPRYGPRRLMTAALLLAALRWLLIATAVGSLPLLIFAQTLHAASFGVYHAVGIYMVNRLFVGANQGRGQALYSSLTFGAGVALGSLLAGYGWEALGGAQTFLLAALLAAGAGAVARWGLPRTV